MSSPLAADRTQRTGRALVAALVVTTITPALGTSIANVALPVLSSTFGVSPAAAQWVTLAYLLSSTLAVVPVGRLGDVLGRQRVLLWGIAAFVAGAAGAAAAPGPGWLVAARAVQGLGAGAMLALPLAMVRQVVPPQRLGAVVGVMGAATAVGMALGPAVGGLALGALSWRWIFAILAGMGVMSLVMTKTVLPSLRPARLTHMSFDWAGVAALAVALVTYLLAVTQQPGGVVGTAGILGVALLAGAGFVRIERAAGAPLVDLAAIRARHLGGHLWVALLAAVVMMAFMAVSPFFLSGVFGLDGVGLGAVMAAGPLAAAATGAPAGRLVDRWGTRRVGGIGLAMMAVGMVVLAVLPTMVGLPGYLVGSVVLTPGNQLFMAANNVTVMRSVAPSELGVGSAVLNLARNVGLVTGSGVVMALYASVVHAAGGVASGAGGVVVGTQAAFVASAIVALSGLVVVARGRQPA